MLLLKKAQHYDSVEFWTINCLLNQPSTLTLVSLLFVFSTVWLPHHLCHIKLALCTLTKLFHFLIIVCNIFELIHGGYIATGNVNFFPTQCFIKKSALLLNNPLFKKKFKNQLHRVKRTLVMNTILRSNH